MFNNQGCISQTKSAYYSTIICSNEDSPKILFSVYIIHQVLPSEVACSPSVILLPLHSFLFSSFPLSLTSQISSVSQTLRPVSETPFLQFGSKPVYPLCCPSSLLSSTPHLPLDLFLFPSKFW